MKTLLAITAVLFLAGVSPSASAQSCNIMCPVDTFPNRDKCKCEPMMSLMPCMLVCLGPGQELDAKKCRCVTPGKGSNMSVFR